MSIPDNDIVDEVSKSCKPRIDMKNSIDFLRGYDGINENVINNFIDQNINYSDMAALDDEDLELLGIRNEVNRKNVLKDFEKDCRTEHFASFMRQMDVNEYRGRVYRNTMKQMLAIYCTLCNLNLNLEKEPFKDNYLVGEVYLSELTLKALEEMKTVIDMIPTKENRPFYKKMAHTIFNWKSCAAIGIAGAAIAIVAFKLNKK